ncbi:hypothetical protein EHV15_35010 [Paenibacillus oralis]|uniref:Accessory regulator AgrB n=1 Tax=Paenibacillus oralis TaxID=2490856 RepID=A0A3P3T9T8_9BACL|nr:hypothetical protein EHV15_35010 [Paenibacillus oralis]
MISKIAYNLAVALLKRSPGNTYSIATIQFSLILLLNVLFTFVFSLILAYILGHTVDTLVLLIASYFLRQYSGGYHMSKSWKCITTTIILSNLIPYVSLSFYVNYLLCIISIILVYIYAPSRIEEDTVIPKEKYSLLKSKSALIIFFNFFLISSPLSVTFLLQALSLITFKRKVVI